MSVCATLAAPTARAQSAREVNALWQKAQAAQREGRWDAAIKSFLVLTALYPTDANAAVGLGYSYYKQGDTERAATLYRSALELDKSHAGALYGLGQVAMGRKQWTQAVESFRDVIRVAPKFESAATRYNLALALHGASQFSEAVQSYREVFSQLAQKPTAGLYRHALESALAAEDFTQAQTWGEAATENYPQDARLWDALAWAYKIRNPAKTSETFARGESLVYRNSEASHRTVLSLPFRGRWRVMQGNGGDFTHRGLSARFAWDFEAIDESGSNRSNAAPRGTNERYLSFGQDVLAPADGRVIAARDGASDNAPHHRSPLSDTGNYLLMEHAPGEFSVLAHLQNGSLAVAVGETVKRGQRVARCGNSGNTALPHLHFSFLGNYGDTRISLPAAFSDYTAWRDGAIKKIARGVPTLDEIVQSTPLESPAPTNDAEKSMR